MVRTMSNVRFPAEWETQSACWTAWPHLQKEWAEDLLPTRAAIAAMCTAIGEGEAIELLVKPGEEKTLPAGHPFRTHPMPFGDIWLRDTGPVWVWRDGQREAVCFRFNGWGGKYELEGDPEVATGIAKKVGASVREVRDVVVEGGALETDGQGTILTTESCLLNKNRNPGRTRADVDRVLREVLGARAVVWLRNGLQNDHTDGHIDNLARFVAPGRVVCMAPSGKDDPNRSVLEEIRGALEIAKTADGKPFEVTTVPSPGAVLDPTGRLMPASYMNFIITNRVVVVPTYGVPADESAVAGLTPLFPGRRVVPILARHVLSGGGAFHCITCHQPEKP